MSDPGRQSHVRLTDLTVTYPVDGREFTAVDRVSLEIGAGEFVAVLGPSGCGKSTILRVLAGLRSPSGGTAEIGGAVIDGPRRDVGVVFQDPTLLPWKTIFENVCLPGVIMGLDRKLVADRARHLLELSGLSAFHNHYPDQLSGGMRQRVGIARSLVHDPSVLLMDEPFGALDAMTRERMNLEIQRIWAEGRKTVFFITHSIPEAVLLGDRIVVFASRPGRIVEDMRNDLPRPRSLDVMSSPAFIERAAHLRDLFNVAAAPNGHV